MDIQNLIANSSKLQLVINFNDLKDVCSYLYNEERIRQEKLKEQENDGLISTKEVMELLHVSEATLGRWKRKGYLCPKKNGGRNGYYREDVYEILGKKRNLEVD